MIPGEAGNWDSRRLWSLWDMLGKYAWFFFILSDLLRHLHRQLGLPLPPAFSPTTGLTLGNLGRALSAGLLASFNDAGNTALPLPSPSPPMATNALTENERQDLAKNLYCVEWVCRELGMTGILKDIERAKRDSSQLFADRSKMQFHIEHITDRLTDELESELFFHVPDSKAKYFRKEDLFGSDIAIKFSKAQEDLTNAGNAFALGLNTACVFHLMRVLEHCVQRFGAKLKVSIDVQNEPWANVIDHINNAIDRRPGGRKATIKATAAQKLRRQQMALAATRLDHVRLVWRNDVMHPKATYDEAEALNILNAVQAFLESLVKVV